MNRALAVVFLAMTIGASSSALAQYGGAGGGGGGGGHAATGNVDPGGPSAPEETTPAEPPDPEAHAEDLRLHGQCAQAVPIFRRLSARGGFEIAQFNLGLCLLDLSKAEPEAQRASGLRAEGATNILAAANSGLANAQMNMVSLYLDGIGVLSDPIEAGKWALLYHSNGSRFVISLPDISPELQARLDGVLSAASWAEARSRADAWSPTAKDWDSSR